MLADNYAFWKEHERKEQEQLEMLPKCDMCDKPIQEDFYFEDCCMRICDGCWNDYVRANFLKIMEV